MEEPLNLYRLGQVDRPGKDILGGASRRKHLLRCRNMVPALAQRIGHRNRKLKDNDSVKSAGAST
ncbi:hypothetical protein DXT94_24145 [Rhizobium sp. ICMP 5592]|nr:hypothetical protein [Rhizobium sp. ICMP 5592]